MAIFRVPARIEYTAPGGPGVNVWHVRTTGTLPSDDTSELHNAIDALKVFYDAIKASYNSATKITLGENIVKDPLGSPEYETDYSQVVTGTASGNIAPTLLAVVVGWRTVSATRSGRGRTFLGPLAGGAMDTDGTITGANLTTIRTAAAALVTASLAPGGWSVGVLSHKDGLFRDAIGSSVRDRMSYLSSRRGG